MRTTASADEPARSAATLSGGAVRATAHAHRDLERAPARRPRGERRTTKRARGGGAGGGVKRRTTREDESRRRAEAPARRAPTHLGKADVDGADGGDERLERERDADVPFHAPAPRSPVDGARNAPPRPRPRRRSDRAPSRSRWPVAIDRPKSGVCRAEGKGAITITAGKNTRAVAREKHGARKREP